MTELSDRIAELSDERLRLLTKLRRERRDNAPIPRREPGPAPLSFAQRRLWFVHQMGGVAYSAPVIYRVRGPLDVGVLDASLRTLLHRHTSLRTVFPEHDGEPVQVVLDVPDQVLRLVSASGEAEAERLLRAEVRTPFDLTTGPVIRTTVIEIGPDDHLLVLNIHHITSDQWSMGVLVRELAETYAALSEGREPRLAPLPVTYADFAAWQRDRTEVLHHKLAQWRERLAGLPELDLPADRPRPPVPANSGAETAIWLPPEVVSDLRTAGENAGTSPFMTLLAAFACLLSRYTGETDIAVGTTSAGRDSDQLAELIGFFVNTLVLRFDTSGDPTFAQLLDRVRASVLDAHQRADVPFDLVVEDLRPQRDPSRPPLVSIMFQQDNTPDCALRLRGADVELVDDFDPGTAKYDLLVSVRVWDDVARVHVQYSTELFDADTVDRFLAAYRTLLTAAAAGPSTPISALPLLDETERRRVLVEWNDTAQPGEDRCLHELFASRPPEAVAAVSSGVTYTFGELDRWSNRLAHQLISRGVRPGELVALCLPPGVEHLVAVLATLKAGAAFVPVDQEYPRSRIDFILDDSGARVVLTDASAGDFPDTPPPVTVTPDDHCYVIYTSGSTGTPKGVVLRHRGVVNNLVDLNRRFGVGPGDSVLALSSPSFDMSVYELLGVTGAGATVVFPEPELLREPAHWADLITEHGITLWNSAPALLELLLDHVEQSADAPPESVRLALLGGDWIPVTMPDRLRALAPDVRFISLGGATEVSVHSICYEVEDVDPRWTAIPYGRPLANQSAFVLDEHGEPLPVGVPGELHLGGAGVAAGYLNRPELTARKFVRGLYRTGDLARWRPDGVLELLGRKDFMVKINGLRIELGEIEAALRAHPAVTGAVVVPDGTDLVAYVTGSPDDLRAFLADRLPRYMLPHRVVALDRFPMTPNGKVDRKALSSYRAAVAQDSEPPSGPVEERIAAVWREVLGVPVNRHDDFFALGGDSFKAVRVARLIDPALPVIAVFRSPTVAGIAAELGSAGGGPRLIHRLTPERAATVTVVCVPYGGGNPVAYQPLADALPDDFALWAVDLPGHDLADPRPLAPIAEVAPACAEEIKARVDGPVALYGQCAGTAATLLLARCLEKIGVEVTATFMGAALPDRDPEASWRMLTTGTDEQLFGHMRRLGGFDGVLADSDVADILRVVRHDLTEMVGLYRAEAGQEVPRLSGPVHCVVGDADPATGGFAELYQDWGHYGSGVTVSVIPGGGHYFCKHQPDAVAGVVRRHLTGGAR